MASVARGDRRRVRPPAASVVAAALSCPFTILSCIPPPRPARPLQPRASRADCTSRSAARPSSIGRPRSVISTFAEFFGFTICLRSFAESAPRDRSREQTYERALLSVTREILPFLNFFFPFFLFLPFFPFSFFFPFSSFFLFYFLPLFLGGFLGSAVFRDLLFTFLRSERGKIRLSRAIHDAETTLDYDHCQRPTATTEFRPRQRSLPCRFSFPCAYTTLRGPPRLVRYNEKRSRGKKRKGG